MLASSRYNAVALLLSCAYFHVNMGVVLQLSCWHLLPCCYRVVISLLAWVLSCCYRAGIFSLSCCCLGVTMLLMTGPSTFFGKSVCQHQLAGAGSMATRSDSRTTQGLLVWGVSQGCCCLVVILMLPWCCLVVTLLLSCCRLVVAFCCIVSIYAVSLPLSCC